MRLRHVVRTVTGHPITTLLVALVLILTSVVEVYRDVEEDAVGAHHGLLLFGLLSLLRVIPDLVEGLERLLDQIERDA